MKNISVKSKADSVFCQEYFAAANTCHGFKSYFGDIFDKKDIKKIYILKGGPGVGKSTLMKTAVRNAEKKGLSTEKYFCSSDPDSLDGIIIKETGKAILDGTSPHVFDPVYPGARDIIVNMGEAWDTVKLERHRPELEELTALKSSCYKNAYRFLSAANIVSEELSDLCKSFTIKEKESAAAKRFADRYLGKKGGEIFNYKICNAISCKGEIRLFTPEEKAETLFFIKPFKNMEWQFLSCLLNIAKSRGINAEAGIRPLNTNMVTYLYFPDNRITVSIYDEEYCTASEKKGRCCKIINPGRFLDPDKFSACKNKFKFNEKLYNTLIHAASGELKTAGMYHSQLEKIYGNATDYGKIKKMSEKVSDDVIK